MSVKSSPQRMCIGCRTMQDKKSLVRVVRLAHEGGVAVDRTGKAAGRGCYLCDQPACWKKAQKSRAVERALGVTIPEDTYETIAYEFERKALIGGKPNGA